MTRTTENTIHRGLLAQVLTGAPATGGLGWTEGQANQVERDGMLLPASLLRFLAHGSQANADAWAGLVKVAGSQKNAEDKALEAVRGALERANSVVQLLRAGLRVEGSTFSLWNRPFRRGDLHANRHAFSQNEFITVPELTVHSRVDPARRKHKRVDQAFFINGLLYALLEVKAKQTSQSAQLEGVSKLAGDFRFFAFEALIQTRKQFAQENRDLDGKETRWPGIDAGDKHLHHRWRQQIMNAMPAYTKVAWLGIMDGTQILLAPDPNLWIQACDRAITRALNGRSINDLTGPLAPDLDKGLHAQMAKVCQRLPDVQGKPTAWDGLCEHLKGLLSGSGVAREIDVWHHPVRDKSKADRVIRGHLLRPRAPQRVALQQIMAQVDHYYANEHDQGWIERDLRERLAKSLPALSQEQVEAVLTDRLKYRNGRDAYSVLVQGAAGLGKTNIAVWAATELYGLHEPLAPGSHPDTPRKPLFDRIVILTDRVELRENIADEAQRAGGTRGQVMGVEDQDTLVRALTGLPLAGGKKKADILVVNLQKFPSLRAALQGQDLKVKHTVGRTAFIIDEVHRSQNGELNEAALRTFLDDLVELAGGADTRKNLIIGLTATPSDTILARFGQWRPGVGASDQARWVPHFSYAMNQAIKDGYVLDPLKRMTRLAIPLDIKQTETLQNAGDADRVELASLEVYEDETRQRLVARKHAYIFACNTIMAMPHGHHMVGVGRGKSMITVPSIRAAINMAKLLREELAAMAVNAEGMPWERYADVVADVAKNRVFVLFSNTGTGQGRDMGDFSNHNPIKGKPTEKQILDAFRCKGGIDNKRRNAIIVVVDKLLTGFDEPTLHMLHIDRSLTGISLFQAMCRPNRVTEGKTECLIIDTCRDETVFREARKVFERYGGMATSDLDGLELLERIRERRARLLNQEGLADLIKQERGLDENARALVRQQWVGNQSRDVRLACALRKQIGGYLADQKLAKPLMVLPPKDLDENWLGLLREIHTLLRVDEDEHRVAPVLFEAQEVGMDEIDTVDDPLKAGSRDNPDDDGDLSSHIKSLVDQLEDLQTDEDARRQRIEEIHTFFQEVFQRIDEESLKSNNDAFRRSLSDPDNPLDHVEALNRFARLFDAATGGRGWLGKGDVRRRYRDAIRERGLDLLLIEYRLSTQRRK